MASWSLDECNAQPDIQAHYQTQFTEEWKEIYINKLRKRKKLSMVRVFYCCCHSVYLEGHFKLRATIKGGKRFKWVQRTESLWRGQTMNPHSSSLQSSGGPAKNFSSSFSPHSFTVFRCTAAQCGSVLSVKLYKGVLRLLETCFK